jgi:hypothetical protein
MGLHAYTFFLSAMRKEKVTPAASRVVGMTYFVVFSY